MTKMIAMTVAERGGRLQKVERDLPEPGRQEVRIRVHACGVCHSDSLTVQGLMPGISYPRIPGHEVIGVIDALRSAYGATRMICKDRQPSRIAHPSVA
jgi:D-arabinose 1-dehydrogenase-like Zn-dependent alcohol dehydrogenase